MQSTLLNDRDIQFLLYEFLDTEALSQRPRYSEHSREIFDATLDTARNIAERYFANHYSKGDANEPQFDGERVTQIPETAEAWQAFADAGFLAAHYDSDQGGLQLPEIILRASMAYISAANIASAAYPFLTIGAANLIHSFASETHRQRYLPHMQNGRFAGTMALTEPDQGSALADIRTTAKLDKNGQYRLFGQKMFISGGDQAITENIIHMVLARIEGAPAGTRGISLFICPKYLVNDDGSLGERNDVALAGLLHKMGYRNTTSTVLNFGEKDGAKAFLVGEAGHGLKYMFQMMNEARIGVALGAACLGYQGYNDSLNYARERKQGRHPSDKDPTSPQLALVEHADVRRMLLAQKAFAEGGMALCFYASSLVEETRTGETEQARNDAGTLLDFITPIVKSWPSKYCLQANELAIQVLGGSGYIREYPVEQYYRDNRLNPIHEGAEGIHGIDLLGRKLPYANGAAYKLFRQQVLQCATDAGQHSDIAPLGELLAKATSTLDGVNAALISALIDNPNRALANATVYLDMLGRITASWMWVRKAITACAALSSDLHQSDKDFYNGKLQAARYYLHWELPQIEPQAALLTALEGTPFEMQNNWF